MTDAMLTEDQIMGQTDTMKKAQTKKVDELNVLFPEPNVFRVNDEMLAVREFTFGELPSAIRLVKKVGPVYMTYRAAGTSNSPEAIVDIVDVGGEDLIQLLALNVKKPREWFDTVPSDIGIAMLLQMLLVNVDFFTNRVIPSLERTLKSSIPGQ